MKILLLDIETSPNTAHVWGLWKQNVAPSQLLESSYILCWAAKWFGQKEIMFDSINQSTEHEMLRGIHALLDEADLVIHYYGKKFDVPTLNKEFLLLGFSPPSPYKQLDLLQTVKKQFKFASNKLGYVCERLGLGAKTAHTGHELWVKCMEGDRNSWRVMEKYNKQDVGLLEKLYIKLLPWITNHPNQNTFNNSVVPVCPKCGSRHLHKRGLERTASLTYQRYQCQSCHGWAKSTVAEKQINKVKVNSM